MEKYQSYKSSGNEWIGEIPDNWSISKFKFLTKKEVQYGINSSSDNYVESGIRFIRTTDILESGSLIEDGVYVDESTIPERQITELYDFLISRSGTLGRTYLHLNDEKYTYGGYLVRFNFGSETLSKFIDYYCKSTSFSNWINLNTIISTIGNVNGQKYNNMELPLPPLESIFEIVQFLDSKNELIDRLISIKERKITLLKEQRISLINQVVTKGLNPNVKMKDSGVEWIGEIPEHWVVTKFNRYVFFQEGPGLRTFQFTDEGTKVICVTNITENGIDFTYKKFISNEEYLEKYKHFTVQKGDLLLSSSGNSWGKVSEYLEDEKVILNTSTIRLNTLDSKRMNKNLIKYILKSEFVRTQLDILMTGSCQPNFGPTHLNQLIIPVPPIDEQIQIISNIEKHDFEFQKIIQLEQKKIDLLKEYRQSLISEVVTGKIKVTTD